MPQISEAVEAALCSDWNRAIQINRAILKENSVNIDALNRLGFAYLNLGETKKAQTAFKKVLRIDPFNPIAQKHIKKLKGPLGKPCNNFQTNAISPKVFLEEPGITKTVNLINLTNRSVLSTLYCGQKVLLIDKKNRMEVRNEESTYLGALPDDLSFHLRKLIKMGNLYCTFIKTVAERQLTVIIREIKRGKKVKDASFIVKLLPKYHTSIRSELLEELLEDESSEEPKESSESEEEESDEE